MPPLARFGFGGPAFRHETSLTVAAFGEGRGVFVGLLFGTLGAGQGCMRGSLCLLRRQTGLRMFTHTGKRKDEAMKMIHLNLEQLTLSPLNVRKIGGKEIADLLPSIRSLGIIQPLLVRKLAEDGADGGAGNADDTGKGATGGAGGGKNARATKGGRAGKAGTADAGAVDTTGKPGDRAGSGTASRYEIVAGQRRYHALIKLAEDGIADPVPCMVMEDGEDAQAVEASLSENIARLPMDEIDQYKAFASLKKAGLDIPEIASRYSVTERLVRQRLAIATIMQPILNAYRREEIGADTLRAMTMATPRQQKAWWTLFRDEEAYAPQGRALREWLLGGAQIPVTNALFDPEAYGGAIISDLFGEDSFFADPDRFWQLQMAAIAEKRDTYLANGWSDVIVQEPGEWFRNWDYRKLAKSKGGKVIVSLTEPPRVCRRRFGLSHAATACSSSMA
ncbi:MAG: ParB/RepB/Spo0J family partition protein [Brucellaceae bacterium]|nr:ParB/RepB/Spo0J family partition protein [Brucellaceae bacterium]